MADDEYAMPDDPTANDAEWKKIQRNTFTRWCNEHLKNANLYIFSLEDDLCDGLKLLALLQVLSHKKIRRFNKKPTFRPQKIENIAIALKFIEDEQIKLVNIDASDILKGNLKLILGLIWTLILKYQISLPMMDDDDEEQSNITPKQALMGWVKSKLPPEVPMTNFNKDWSNGVAVGALVDAVAPGLFPEWEDLDPKDKVENAKKAMKLAEDWLGVPQVITPEEITNPNVDELSVMTYVSYFPEAKLKSGAPLKPKLTSASKSSASGPGIQEHGVIVNKPADFKVTSSGSSKGKLSVQVFGPGRKTIDCQVQDNQDNTYSCQYTPVKEGVYDVHIRVGGHHIPKSPFRVNVSSGLDTSKVTAKGPGLEPQGVIVGRPALFEVFAANAGSGNLSVDVIDPKGNKKTELKVEDQGDQNYKCQYLPQMVGRYVIVLKFGGKEVAKSPYHVNVTPAADRVKIFGPGLEPGLKTGKPTTFTIDCKEAGDGPLDVKIEGPGRTDIKADVVNNNDGTYTCTYRPTKPGQYTISVKFDSALVPQCPVKVAVGTSADSSTKIKAWGSGLERGVVGRPAEFFVNCKNAPVDNLTVGVEGPGDAKVEMADSGNGDGTMVVKYYPTKPGKYIIHVRYEEMDIKESPYTAIISPRGDVSKVYAEGPGLLDGNMAGKPCEFTVFTKGAGVKTPSVQLAAVCEDTGEEVECKVKDNNDGTFKCIYYPKTPGAYKIHILFMDEPIPQAPVAVTIKPFCDPSKVKAYGPGLTGGKVKKPAQFNIDATKAGEGGIDVTIEGPTETEIKYDDHGDGSCGVEYLPVEEGEYKINVLFDQQHVPGSPFTAMISNEFDASKVKIDGPGLKPGNKAGEPCVVNIDAKKAGKAGLGCEVFDEENNPVKTEVVEKEPGVFVMTYFPEIEGTHTINVTYGGKPVPKTPAKVKIIPSADGSKVKVFGPGVEPDKVKCNEPTYFDIDATNAGKGEPAVTIECTSKDKNNAPKVKDIKITPGDKPNTYKVTYTGPEEPEEFIITVTFGRQPVPKSPFKIKVSLKWDASKCKAHGPGIEEPVVKRDNVFTVDVPKEAGEAELTCEIVSPTGKKTPVKITPNNKGGFDVCYKPTEKGPYKITVKFGGDDIPGSTFTVDVLPEPDPKKVKAYGPGLEKAVSGCPAQFTVETKEAGPGDLGLTIEGPEEAPINCKDNGDGTCSVEYIPKVPGEYDVNILFDGVHIPGSPFKVGASEPVDVSKVKVKGPGVGKAVPASFPAEFTVDATKTGKAPLEVEVVGPNDKVYPCEVKDNGDKTFDCSYMPEKKGNYTVTPKYGGTPVPGAPFKVKGEPTGDASKVKCSGPGLEKPHPGYAAPFEIDTTKAGKGNPIINAKGPNGENLPVKLVEEDEGVYACEYMPEELGPHEVEVLFGGLPVPGSTFKADATPAPEVGKVNAQVLEEVLEAGPCVEQEFEAPVDCSEVPDHKEAILTGKITVPSGKKEPVDVTDNHDGTFALNYTPKDVGKYILDVGYDGIPIPGSPFEFEVTEGGPDKVNVYGKGIRKGVVAVPARFTVDTKNAGPGDLSVAVEGPSKVDITCVDNGDGTCEVTYVPIEPGDYDVIVKFDNQSVPGSPFKPKVLQNEPAVEVGCPSDICLSPDGISPKDLPSLKGVLQSPSGKEIPVDLKEGPDDSIMASFVPEEAGINQLHLKKNNKPVDGSPVPVLAREKPIIGKDSTVPLECPDCDIPKDLPKMTGVLTRPNGKDEPVKVEEGPDKTIAFTFVPEEPGKHLISVFKDGKQVEDSPYVVMVEGTSPDQYPHVGEPCDKGFFQPEPCTANDINKMVSTLRRPTGKEEPVDVKLGPDGTIAVSFVPTEAGEHLVSVKKDGLHVPHSPFSIMVIDEPTMPTVGSECAANFDIPELDLPKDLKLLKGTLTRPNGKEEPLELGVGPDESLAINFIPEEPGKHIIGIKKRGKHVKDSPFEIMVGEAKPKSKGPTVGQDCAANLDCQDLNLPDDLKDLTGVVECPNGEKKPVELAASPDGTLDVNFTPEMPGEHLVHVAKKGKPIKDSPFPIMVEDGEPTGPTVDRECGVNLDIPELDLPKDLKDVTGELTRPNGKKEPLECSMGPEETLGVAFTPTEPGKHLIDIKKKGKPVKGSPFEVDVAPAHGKPIEEDIVPMLEDGVESSPYFAEPEFLDKDAPATVGEPCLHSLGVPSPENPKKLDGEIKTPSGKKTPADLKKAPDGTLAVEFTPEEAGPHYVDVKDDKGKPIKGSPFKILAEETPKVGHPCNLDKDVPDITLPRDLKDLKATVTSPSGKKSPVECTTTPDKTLGLEFTPEEPGKHVIDVTKRGKPIKGSPFEVIIEEDEDQPKVNEPCNMEKDLPDVTLPGDLKDLKATVTTPSGKKSPVECTVTPENTLGLEFTPEEPGKHVIDVTKKGKPVKGSPFAVFIGEEEPILPKVGDVCDLDYDIPDVTLPKDLKDLEATVTRPSGKRDPVECTSTPDNTLGLEFTPEEPGKHIIDVKKKGKPVKGSPFEVIVAEEEPTKPKVGDKCDLDYDLPDVTLPKDLKDLKAMLTRPDGKKEPIECTTTPENTLGLEFTPDQPGKHVIDVTKKGKPVKGSPFVVLVEEEKPTPKVGDKCEMDYDLPDVILPKDLKDLKATVKRPNGKKEPIKCTCTPDNTLGLEFTPEEPGKHIITVTKKGKPVKGSPFIVIVEEEQPTKPTVGNTCEVDYDIPDVTLPRDLKDLTATVIRPSGKKEPVECTVTPDNTLGLEFTPEEPGKHVIEVLKRGKPVKGSPFEIIVEEDTPAGSKPTVGHKCDVDFDIPEIVLPRDLKELKAKLIRPDRTEESIPCTCSPDKTLGLEFVPKQPGEHKIIVTKHGRPVKGSPFIIMVEEDTDTSPEAKPTVGNKCEVDFDIPDVHLPQDLKNLKAKLTRPSGLKEEIKCTCSPDNTLGLEFTPNEPGKHIIDVTKNGRPVKGSPFVVMVEEDTSADSKPTVGHKCDVDFDIPDVSLPNDLKVLKATLTRPTGQKEPVECTCTPDNTLGLEFTPKEPGKHVIEVTKNGRPVKGSPFIVMVEEDQSPSSKPTVGNKCDVDFEIPDVNLPDDIPHLTAQLTRPSGKPEPIKCTVTPDNTLGLEFTPEEPGKHVIEVKKKGKPVKGSPFVVMVEDDVAPESKPTVGHKCDVDFDIPDVTLPRDLKDLKAKLTRPSGVVEDIPCNCSPENTLGLEFTPVEPGKHVIEVTKKGRPVKGSPFEVMVEVDQSSAPKVPTVGSECDVNLDIPDLNLPRDFQNLKGTLKRPGKNTEEPLKLILNDNNTIGIVFVPDQVGRHEVSVKKNGKHVTGSPFEVIVHEVADQGPRIGCPVDLSLDITIAPNDLKFMKASLSKPSGEESPLDLKLNDKNQPIVTFTPEEAGLYKVNIKKNGKHVPGSPIEVLVSQGKKKPTCDVGFEIPGIRLPDDLKYLKGSVVSPSGTEEPVELQVGPNNTIVISFLPKEVGTHYIHIKKHGKHVGDSPYEVQVKPEDVAPGKPDASKVKCTGPGLRSGKPNKKADFTVDTRDAGYGGLGLSVEGPSKVEINCVDNEDGTCSVDYVPTEPGTYLINVTYADAHVPGSPFKCRISPDGLPIDEDEIVALMEDGVESGNGEFSDMLAFPSSKARSPQDFVIKFSGTGDLKASVTRPSGIEDDAEVVETGPDTYTVRFVPRETGEHLVNVKSKRRHIPGSPFKVIVEAPAGGANACKAYGPGLDGGNAGQPCKFTVITRDAGPGGLAVAVEGPAKAEIQCHDNGDGSCDITWYPVESGEYTIHIRFADEAIPGSPYKVFVQPADEGKAMSMENFKDQVLRVGQQASFAVQMKGKKGKITASVTSPSSAQIDCNVAELEEGNYAVRFVPRELGDHLVSVFLDGHHIPGSPFTVKVGGLEGDPSKVIAYGPGLKGGLVGKPAEFTVNALDAGSGALALSIDGPAKVKMNCVEQDDGTYKVIYNPTVSGIYEISIRFAGQHIPGSAYKVHIAANADELDSLSFSGDASKCTSKGKGLHEAHVGEAATFTVDASNAGRGAIMVGVEGPVIPAKEIVVRHAGQNVYSVNYVLEEPGDYVLQVLWAGKHIPGSPFHLTV